MFWLSVIILQGFMQFFFLSRTAESEWRVNEMSGNGLSMERDLCLCLHIN